MEWFGVLHVQLPQPLDPVGRHSQNKYYRSLEMGTVAMIRHLCFRAFVVAVDAGVVVAASVSVLLAAV